MKIKSCPFRHKETGQYEIVAVSRPLNVEFCVECQKCGARGPTAETPIKARNAWNRGRRPELTRDSTQPNNQQEKRRV